MKQIIINEHIERSLQQKTERHGSYDKFSKCKEDAYEFVRLLDVKVCPYCNINYIYVVFDHKGQGVTRPDLDHFMPRFNNSMHSLDWHNLIPACSRCNSRLKGRLDFTSETHLHPYDDDFDSIMRISVYLRSPDYLDEDNFDISFVVRNADISTKDYERAEANIRDFHLESRYQYHKDEIVRTLRRIRCYHRHKLKELGNMLGTKLEMFALLFQDEDCEINNTSLGKLKRDVIREYK